MFDWSLYVDAIELELHGVVICRPAIRKICESLTILLECSENTVPLTTFAGPGRPPFKILPERLEHLMELGFTTVSMASILGVSRSTVARRLREYGLCASMKYCCISDDHLNEVVTSISHQYPGCGQMMMQGHLRERGIVVQQSRVRGSLH